jgi:hypothetical protein
LAVKFPTVPITGERGSSPSTDRARALASGPLTTPATSMPWTTTSTGGRRTTEGGRIDPATLRETAMTAELLP